MTRSSEGDAHSTSPRLSVRSTKSEEFSAINRKCSSAAARSSSAWTWAVMSRSSITVRSNSPSRRSRRALISLQRNPPSPCRRRTRARTTSAPSATAALTSAATRAVSGLNLGHRTAHQFGHGPAENLLDGVGGGQHGATGVEHQDGVRRGHHRQPGQVTGRQRMTVVGQEAATEQSGGDIHRRLRLLRHSPPTPVVGAPCPVVCRRPRTPTTRIVRLPAWCLLRAARRGVERHSRRQLLTRYDLGERVVVVVGVEAGTILAGDDAAGTAVAGTRGRHRVLVVVAGRPPREDPSRFSKTTPSRE